MCVVDGLGEGKNEIEAHSTAEARHMEYSTYVDSSIVTCRVLYMNPESL